MRNRILNSARARFMATAATVFALVALGGVTATPAYADGTIQITVTDASAGGAAYGGPQIYVGNTVVFLSGGMQSFPLAAGTYIVKPTDTSYFNANTSVVVTEGATTPFAIELDKYHVTGSIPTDVGADTTVSVQAQNGGAFDPIAGTDQTIPSGTSSFDVRVPYGPSTYRLKFHPVAGSYFDTYSAPFTITGSSLSQAIGYTAFGSAGSISGTVLSNADSTAVTGATVYAEESGTVIGSTTVASDGSYVLSFGASSDTDVLVRASATGFVDQYYNGAASSGFANTVSLTSTNSYSASAINFSLVADLADVTGNLTQYGGGNEPSPADIYLYKFDAGANAYLATPYGIVSGSANFAFTDLPDGSYRLAFRNADTDQLLTWQLRDRYGSLTYPPYSGGYGACSLDFGVSGGADINFFNVEVVGQAYAGYCSGPPYGSGTDKTVTGTVSNTASLSPTVYAKLYKVASGGSFSLIDISAVNSTTGVYSLGGVRDSGNYFIQFAPDAASSYLPTLLGDANASTWAKDAATIAAFATDQSFAVDIAVDTTLSGHDVTLVEGALITGTMLTAMGGTIHGKVVFTNVADSTDTLTVIGNGDGWGSWRVVLPVGGSYTMRAIALEGTYVSEYWQNAIRLIDADAIGPLTAGNFAAYEFRLASSPPVISGEVSDATATDPITVHLFFKDELGLWRPVEKQDSVAGAFLFKLNYDTAANDGLVAGDYRMRFEASNGVWLAATSYTTGLLPSTWNAPVTGQNCYVDVTVASGPATAIDASFNIAAQTQSCAAEPAVEGDVTGHMVWNGTVDVANQTVVIYNGNYDFFETTTDVNGNFTFEAVTNGTWSMYMFPDENHVLLEHEYSFFDEFDIAGGADLGDLVPLRYGNVTGTITDWDLSMVGATATVFTDCGCGYGWDAAEPWITVEIDEFGYFEAPGVGAAGDYSVLIEPADGSNAFVPTFLRGGLGVPDAPFTSAAEQDYGYGEIALNPVDFVVISGTVFYGDFPLESAEVWAVPADGRAFGFYTDVLEDGTYELLVAPNVDYTVGAESYPLYGQLYNGINIDADYDPANTGDVVEVGVVEVGNIDFSLVAPEGVYFDFSIGTYAGSPGSSYNFNDVVVHLYKYVIDGWEEVDTQTSDPYVDLASSGDGDYRLRFSNADGWLSIDKVRWSNDLPPYDTSDGYYDYGAGGTAETDACFLDFDNTAHGSQIWGNILLDDPTLLSCGEETLAEHYVVNGTATTTSTFGNAPIEGQTVTLTNDTTFAEITTTTDADGVFSLAGASPGTYTLAFPATDVAGHTYVDRSVPVEVVDATVQLDPLELTRYGNAEVEVLNWNAAAMDGTTARAYRLIGSTRTPIGAAVTVDSIGTVVLPAITVNGEYSIYFDYPTGLIDGYLESIDVEEQTFTGTAEEDATGLETYALTTIVGTVRTGGLAVNGATVEADGSAGPSEFTTTDASGNYVVVVPAGATYDVFASKTGLVSDALTAVVAYVPKTGADLQLHYASFSTRVFEDDGLGNNTALPTTAHLYKMVAGGWQQVAFGATFGPSLWTNTSGNYRLRFSNGAAWVPIDLYELTDGAAVVPVPTLVDPDPSVCYIDFSPATAGAEYQVSVSTSDTPSVTCAAEPAVVVPPVKLGSKGSGAGSTDETEATPTATPTPTPTPTAEPGDTDEGGTDEGVVEKPTTTSAPDFTWLFWLAGILALLILAGGAIYFVRRRT